MSSEMTEIREETEETAAGQTQGEAASCPAAAEEKPAPKKTSSRKSSAGKSSGKSGKKADKAKAAEDTETKDNGMPDGEADVSEDVSVQEEMQNRLDKLVKQARKKGDVLDYQEVVNAFSDMELEDEKYDLITAYLEGKGIDVLNLEDDDQEEIQNISDTDIVDDDDVPNEELELIEQEELDENTTDQDDSVNADSVNIEDPVRMYLKEIGKVPLLTAEEEVAIAKRMENGDIARSMLETLFADVADDDAEKVTTQEEFLAALNEDQRPEADEKAEFLLGKNKAQLQEIVADGEEARKKLAEANLRLVVSIAKRYVGRGMLFLDLIQEGNLGLIKAVEKFDFRKGFKFSTYATWWIRQAITRAIADQARTIRIPVHMVETINKLVRVSRQLLQELGREPTPEEIAERMNIPVERVREIIKISQEPVSLETPIGEEEDSHLGDFIQDENVPVPADAAAYTLLKEQLQEVLGTLTEREQKVLRLRFGLDDGRARTLEEVGREFNVTRERIRQIEAKALRKLRHPSRSRKLKDYLD